MSYDESQCLGSHGGHEPLAHLVYTRADMQSDKTGTSIYAGGTWRIAHGVRERTLSPKARRKIR